MSRPDWLVPGARVVEFTPSRTTHGGRIEETTIDRVLARDVVLANGNRWNADRLRKQAGTWDPTRELLSVDDPKVERAREVNRMAEASRRARRYADALWLAINEYQSGKAGFGAVDEALRSLTGAVDDIRRCRP